jgi:hypothetical protein
MGLTTPVFIQVATPDIRSVSAKARDGTFRNTVSLSLRVKSARLLPIEDRRREEEKVKGADHDLSVQAVLRGLRIRKWPRDPLSFPFSSPFQIYLSI